MIEIYEGFFVSNERIIIDPEICLGKPCIKGTRLTVEFILEHPAINGNDISFNQCPLAWKTMHYLLIN